MPLRLELGAARILVPTGIHRGDVIDVRALVEHPMATGLFRDADGHPIPAHFINDVRVMYGDREVARFVWTSGISRDPFVQFSLRADREAELRFIWKDNRDGVFQQSVDIKFVA
jgi:sulfur-oxidizing protein SoxZ